MRGGEQPVDDFAKGVWGIVGEKVGDLLHRRRETGQVIRRAANEHALGRRRGGAQLVGLELGEDEKVEILPWPTAGLHLGQCRFAWFAERPKLPRLVEVDLFGLDLGQATFARVGGAHLDPSFEVLDDRLGQAALGRHHQLRVEVGDRAVEIALVRFSGDDRS